MQTPARYLCENLLKSQNGLCAVLLKTKISGRRKPVFLDEYSIEHRLTMIYKSSVTSTG